MKIVLVIFLATSAFVMAIAKEIALSFDDAPMDSSQHFETHARTEMLIKKLKILNIPSVIIFANPCKREDSKSVIQQLKKYRDAGHVIGNHTCTHPRLDDLGFSKYSKDIEKADKILSPLFSGQKFFRYPFFNEGKDEKLRNEIRTWLQKDQYKNGMVSVDDEDYVFSYKINQAKKMDKKIDYSKIEALFVKHLIDSANFYDTLAVKTLGYSPKHVMLLHEMDATVLFIDSLVKELRRQGWIIISAKEAYQDKMYLENLNNTYANDGIIAQLAMEKTGQKVGHNKIDELKAELNKILDLNE